MQYIEARFQLLKYSLGTAFVPKLFLKKVQVIEGVLEKSGRQ